MQSENEFVLTQSSRRSSCYLDTQVGNAVAVARLQPRRAKHKFTLTTAAKTTTISRGKGSSGSNSTTQAVGSHGVDSHSHKANDYRQTADDGQLTVGRVSRSQDVNKRHSIRVPDSAAPCVRVPKRASRMRIFNTVNSVVASEPNSVCVQWCNGGGYCCQWLSSRRALCTRTLCV